MQQPSKDYLEFRFFSDLADIGAKETVWYSLLEKKKEQILETLLDTLNLGFSTEEFLQACEASKARGLSHLGELKQKCRTEILLPLRKAKYLERQGNRKRWMIYHESMESFKMQALSNKAFWESQTEVKKCLDRENLIIDDYLLYDALRENRLPSGDKCHINALFNEDNIFKLLPHRYFTASKLVLQRIEDWGKDHDGILYNLVICCLELGELEQATEYVKKNSKLTFDRKRFNLSWYNGCAMLKYELLNAASQAFKWSITDATYESAHYSARRNLKDQIEEAYTASGHKQELAAFQKWYKGNYG